MIWRRILLRSDRTIADLLLKEQGMQMNQQVKFFSDGGVDIRDMQL